MSVNWPLLIILPCFLGVMLMRVKYSLWVCSFFSSYSATSALNFMSSSESGSGISVSWFGLFFLSIIFILRRQNLEQQGIKNSVRFSNISIIAYWIFAIFSLIGLWFLDSNATILDEFIFKNPGFDLSNVVRFLFFSIGILFVQQFSIKAREREVVFIMNSFIIGTTSACAIGLYDHFTQSFMLAEVFNNSISKFAQGYTADGKISGPAVEPSILVQVIGVSLSMGIMKFQSGKISLNISNFILIIFLAIQLLTLIASGAHSTIPVALALLVQIMVFPGSKVFKSFAIIAAPIAIVPYISSLGDKLSTFSGLERLGSIASSFDAFLSKPLFGFGFAEVTSHDLIVNSLANTGVFATFILLALPLRTIFSAYRNRFYIKSCQTLLMPVAAMFNLFFVMLFSGYSHPFTHLYIVLAIGIWAHIRLGKSKNNNNFTPGLVHQM